MFLRNNDKLLLLLKITTHIYVNYGSLPTLLWRLAKLAIANGS